MDNHPTTRHLVISGFAIPNPMPTRSSADHGPMPRPAAITYTITPAAQRHAFGRARTDYAIVDDRQQEIARVYATLAEDDPAGTARLFAAAPALLELAHEALAAIEENRVVCLRLQDAIRRAEQGE